MLNELMTMEHWRNNLHGKTDIQKMLPTPHHHHSKEFHRLMHKVETLWENGFRVTKDI